MEWTVKFETSLEEIPESDWQQLAEAEPNPFLQYSFLALLESSGAVSPDTGWQPCHFTLRLGSRLQAAAPLYIRSNSWGDFVFDQGFAQAVEGAGLAYYPKLVGTIPLNPVPCWKILTTPDADLKTLWEIFDQETKKLLSAGKLTGRHLLWTEPEFDRFLQATPEGGIPWAHTAYQWTNRNYGGFDDFLGRFTAGQRKNIRKEREKMDRLGLEIRCVDGASAPDQYFRTMEELYTRTNDKFGPMAARFLPEGFFSQMQKRCGSLVKLFCAFEAGEEEPLAIALVMEKGGKAFGRWWGTHKDLDSLHFNLCYYAPQSEAAGRGWATFDPGMGGDHKTRRGFETRLTRSYHWLADVRVRDLFNRYLPLLSLQAQEEREEANQALPFRSTR